jgi:integrase
MASTSSESSGTRFAVVPAEYVESLINGAIPENTAKARRAALLMFLNWWNNVAKISSSIESFVNDQRHSELVQHAITFAVSLRKQNGTYFKIDSLITHLKQLAAALKEPPYGWTKYLFDRRDTITRVFADSIQAHCINLAVSHPFLVRKARQEALTSDEEEKLLTCGLIGERKSPRQLNYLLFLLLSLDFGLRGGAHAALTRQQIQVKTLDGVKYLEAKIYIQKTMKPGMTKPGSYETTLWAFQAEDERFCPVAIYEKVISMHPRRSSAVFLKPNRADTAFTSAPLQKSYLNRLTGKLCDSAGITPRSNHGLRRTMIVNLCAANVSGERITQLAGHHNFQSKNAYTGSSADLARQNQSASKKRSGFRMIKTTVSKRSRNGKESSSQETTVVESSSPEPEKICSQREMPQVSSLILPNPIIPIPPPTPFQAPSITNYGHLFLGSTIMSMHFTLSSPVVAPPPAPRKPFPDLDRYRYKE